MAVDLSEYSKEELREYTKESCFGAVNLLSKKYFNEEPKEVKYIGGGSFGLAYLVTLKEDKKVIKFFRVKGMNRTQALETETLKKHCSVRFPNTLFVHDEDNDIPFDAIGMEFMEGTTCINAIPFFYSKKKRLRLADSLAEALHEIHETKRDTYGLLEGEEYSNWLDYYRPIAERVYNFTVTHGREKVHKISPRMIKLVEFSYDNLDRIFFEPIGEPSLIHGDLNVCNFMVDRRTLELKSIIDPWGTMYADRDYELHQLYNLTGKHFYIYETYKKKYKTSETVDLKTAFYALYNEINCYITSGICFPYIYPRMTRNLERQIEYFLGTKIK